MYVMIFMLPCFNFVPNWIKYIQQYQNSEPCSIDLIMYHFLNFQMKQWTMRFKIKLVFVSAFFILVTIYFLKCLSITDNGSLTKDDFKNFDNTVGSPTPLVPDIIHFIQFDQEEISFIHFICMCSAFYNHASSFIYLHTNVKVLRGKYFNLLKKLFGKVLIVKYLERPSHVYGQRLSSVQHSADVARIKILMEYGGIVLDQDVFVVRNLNRFRHFEVAIGWPKGQNIGTQAIMKKMKYCYSIGWNQWKIANHWKKCRCLAHVYY